MNILVTDLDYENIKPFLDNMMKNKRTKIKVIIPSGHYATQAGQELLEILRLNGIDAYVESINKFVIKKFAYIKIPYITNVNFYSMYFRDLDNLEFAGIAKQYLDTAFGKIKNRTNTINFYISYQDEEFAMNFELEKESLGAIQLVNEYDWVASKFVYENPLTRIADINCTDLANELKKAPKLHVHFFGFGMINKALLKRMFPNYQLPDDENQVTYHILDKSAGTDKYNEAFLARYTALNPMYSNPESGFYPQYNFNNWFKAKDVDFESDEELLNYVKECMDAVKEDNNIINLIFIALGDMKLNVQVANKTRTFVKNVSHAYGDILKKNSFTKSFIIYPYIKDNSFFKRSAKDDEDIYQALKGCKDDQIEAELNKLYDDSNYGKEFNGHLLYVFENKYRKETCIYKPGILAPRMEKLIDRVCKMREIRKAQFKREDCPIVVIGRGGYISDPLRGMIYKIAKHANNNYSKIYDKEFIKKRKKKMRNKDKSILVFDAAEDKWYKANYPKKQSNIGLALTFQMKLNIIGLELKWDKDNVVGKYNKLKGPAKERFKKDNEKRYHGFFETIEKERFNPFGYVCEKNNFSEAGFKKILPSLSQEMQKRLANKELNVDVIKAEFIKEYEKPYQAYANNDESQNPKIINMVTDYFNLLYRSIDNDNLLALTEMEHRRWYVENARYGIVPYLPNDANFDYNMNTKSPDEANHYCMTDGKGLILWAYDILRNLVIKRTLFVDWDPKAWKITGIHPIKGIDEFSFNREDNSHQLFDNLFKTIFEYDLLAYQQTNKLCLVENENKRTQYHFVIRTFEKPQ